MTTQEQKNRWRRQKRRDTRAWFRDLMGTMACNRCGYDADYRALDWHHSTPDTKTRNVSRMVQNGQAQATIEAEIAKCECLCANCHRIHHAEEEEERRG